MSENYLHCISPQELDRLRAQHEAWSPETNALLLRGGFAEFTTIADFGCGPGLTAWDLATQVSPNAEVTGIDVSDYYLNSLRQRAGAEGTGNIRAVQTDATKPLNPKSKLNAYFDGVFCRWFLAWVTKDNRTVLENIHSALKPGGIFCAMEYLTLRSVTCSPACSAMPAYVRAWETFYAETGGTTEVGAILPRQISDGGFTIKDIQTVGGFAPIGHRLYVWWERLYRDFRDRFVERQLLTLDEADMLDRHWVDAASAPSSFIYTPVLVQIVAQKN